MLDSSGKAVLIDLGSSVDYGVNLGSNITGIYTLKDVECIGGIKFDLICLSSMLYFMTCEVPRRPNEDSVADRIATIDSYISSDSEKSSFALKVARLCLKENMNAAELWTESRKLAPAHLLDE